jgi:hypothetical protein
VVHQRQAQEGVRRRRLVQPRLRGVVQQHVHRTVQRRQPRDAVVMQEIREGAEEPAQAGDVARPHGRNRPEQVARAVQRQRRQSPRD